MTYTDDQLRAKLDQGMIYAPGKWQAHVLRIVEAYAEAYENQANILATIEASKRAEAELATFMVSMILPALVGGFVGAIMAANSARGIAVLTDKAAQLRWGMAADVAKTVASDMAKAEVRTAYQHIIQSSGWKPASISPEKFGPHVQLCIANFVTAAADALNNSKMGRTKARYRDVISGLYYSPFIQSAPEIQDMWDSDDLAVVLEIFLWADWANHRDTKYWVDRLSNVTDSSSLDGKSPMKAARLAADFKEIKDLNPIFDRLDNLGVDRAFDSQGVPSADGYRILNILWLRKLAPHYKGTMLGDLLGQLDHPGSASVSIDRRPRSYPLK